jgi:hypothetical protein
MPAIYGIGGTDDSELDEPVGGEPPAHSSAWTRCESIAPEAGSTAELREKMRACYFSYSPGWRARAKGD